MATQFVAHGLLILKDGIPNSPQKTTSCAQASLAALLNLAVHWNGASPREPSTILIVVSLLFRTRLAQLNTHAIPEWHLKSLVGTLRRR